MIHQDTKAFNYNERINNTTYVICIVFFLVYASIKVFIAGREMDTPCNMHFDFMGNLTIQNFTHYLVA